MDDAGLRAVLRYLRPLAEARTATALGDAELLRRFAEAHDEAAFTALVERHGPMVLRVCRRILGHAQDAEDACQATFLVLVRSAASVRKRASAASWLFGVAARTARKLRARRALRERGCGPGEEPACPSAADPSWREACAVLDEELLRLPEKYRAPLLLCYVEGLTRDEAAARLGLSLNALRGRLDYGRTLFRGRLTRRGIALTPLVLGGLLVPQRAAALPALLVVSTVKAATLVAAGRALPAGLVPTRVVALMEGMVQTMVRTKLALTGATLLMLAGLGVGLCTVRREIPARGPGLPPGERAKGERPAEAPKQPVHPLNQALEGLATSYALADGEVLKSFRPPHPKERRAFFRLLEEARSAEEKARLKEIGLGDFEMDGNLDLLWKDGRLEFGSVTFAPPRNPPQGLQLESLLRVLAGVVPGEVEGDRELRWNTLVAGDFVVRDGAAPAAIVARLEAILNQEHKVPVALTLGEADRTVYVLGGTYKFTPATAGGPEDHIDLYADALLPASPDPVNSPPGAGLPFKPPVAEFMQSLSRFLDRRVVLGKVDGLPEHVSWTEHALPFGQGLTPEEWEVAHAPGPVLKHVTEQTGLTVREETRRVRVLTVGRRK
jgi:RNA polymerase sigma-70 factor (ECF subfamily)